MREASKTGESFLEKVYDRCGICPSPGKERCAENAKRRPAPSASERHRRILLGKGVAGAAPCVCASSARMIADSNHQKVSQSSLCFAASHWQLVSWHPISWQPTAFGDAGTRWAAGNPLRGEEGERDEYDREKRRGRVGQQQHDAGHKTHGRRTWPKGRRTQDAGRPASRVQASRKTAGHPKPARHRRRRPLCKQQPAYATPAASSRRRRTPLLPRRAGRRTQGDAGQSIEHAGGRQVAF